MKSNLYLIGLIVLLIISIAIGLFYFQSKLAEAELQPLTKQKNEFILLQKKSKDSTLKLVNELRDSLAISKNKKPNIIKRYNEKIIYKSVVDDSIYNAFSRERDAYIEKQQR